MSTAADLILHEEDGSSVLRFSGNLTLLRVRKLSEQLKDIRAERLVVDLTEVDRMDTVGAWLVHKLERDHGARSSAPTRTSRPSSTTSPAPTSR